MAEEEEEQSRGIIFSPTTDQPTGRPGLKKEPGRFVWSKIRGAFDLRLVEALRAIAPKERRRPKGKGP
jgi:hypothetical protein